MIFKHQSRKHWVVKDCSGDILLHGTPLAYCVCLSVESDASSEHSVSSGGSTSVGSRNTLLAMNTKSQQMKKAINKIDDDMRIDSTFFNPDSLWKRNQEGCVINRVIIEHLSCVQLKGFIAKCDKCQFGRCF